MLKRPILCGVLAGTAASSGNMVRALCPSLVIVTTVLLPIPALATTFFTVDISPSVTDPLVPYDHPPMGNVTLGGVPFELPDLQMVWTAQATARTIQLNGPPVDSAFVLINTTHTFLQEGAYPGEVVGWIDLLFSGGSHQIVELKLGENVREWRPANDCGETINTLISPMARNVHSDSSPLACAQGSGPAVLDMLTVSIDLPYRNLALDAVELLDDSERANGSRNPTIFVAGITLGIEDIVPVAPSTWGRIKRHWGAQL